MTKGHKTEEMKTKTMREREEKKMKGKDGKKEKEKRRLYQEQNSCSGFGKSGGKERSDDGTVSFLTSGSGHLTV